MEEAIQSPDAYISNLLKLIESELPTQYKTLNRTWKTKKLPVQEAYDYDMNIKISAELGQCIEDENTDKMTMYKLSLDSNKSNDSMP